MLLTHFCRWAWPQRALLAQERLRGNDGTEACFKPPKPCHSVCPRGRIPVPPTSQGRRKDPAREGNPGVIVTEPRPLRFQLRLGERTWLSWALHGPEGETRLYKRPHSACLEMPRNAETQKALSILPRNYLFVSFPRALSEFPGNPPPSGPMATRRGFGSHSVLRCAGLSSFSSLKGQQSYPAGPGVHPGHSLSHRHPGNRSLWAVSS